MCMNSGAIIKGDSILQQSEGCVSWYQYEILSNPKPLIDEIQMICKHCENVSTGLAKH